MLEIGGSVIDDPVAVAQFVSQNFPNVRRVSAFCNTFHLPQNIKKVNKLLMRYGSERWAREGTKENKDDNYTRHHQALASAIYGQLEGEVDPTILAYLQ